MLLQAPLVIGGPARVTTPDQKAGFSEESNFLIPLVAAVTIGKKPIQKLVNHLGDGMQVRQEERKANADMIRAQAELVRQAAAPAPAPAQLQVEGAAGQSLAGNPAGGSNTGLYVGGGLVLLLVLTGVVVLALRR